MSGETFDRKTLSRRAFLRLATGTTAAAVVVAACPPVAPAPSAPPAVPAQEPIGLRFTTVGWGGWLAEPWMEMVRQFNESQDRINVVLEDVAEGYAKVMAEAAGDVAADVYTFETKQMFGFAARGFFLPLDDRVATSPIVTEEAYFSEDLPEMSFKGQQYLVPFDNSPAMIWYNTDLFDEAGVDYPPATFDDPDWKWDDFLVTCQELTKGEGADRVFGWAGERWWVYLLNWIWSNGGWLLNEQKTECVIDMPETVEALQWAVDLALTHEVQPHAHQIMEGGNSAMFFGRRAAMAQRGTWWAIDMKAQEELNWNIAPQPMGVAGTFVRNPLDGFGIWQGTEQADASWELIEFFSRPEVMAIIVRAGLSVSRIDVMMSDVFLRQEPQHVHWDLFVQALDGHTRRHPDTAIFAQMNDLLNSSWDAVIEGSISVGDMVDQVKGPINELLAECIGTGDCEG